MANGRLVAAAARHRLRRGRRPTFAVPVLFAALLAYVGALWHVSTMLVTSWRFPESTPYTFEGVEAFGRALTVVNALWIALVVVELVRAFGEPPPLRRPRAASLLAALVVVVLMQSFAWLVVDAAHW